MALRIISPVHNKNKQVLTTDISIMTASTIVVAINVSLLKVKN